MVTEQEVRERIVELEKMRADFVALVEKRLASFDGGIAELKLTLSGYPKPNPNVEEPEDDDQQQSNRD